MVITSSYLTHKRSKTTSKVMRPLQALVKKTRWCQQQDDKDSMGAPALAFPTLDKTSFAGEHVTLEVSFRLCGYGWCMRAGSCSDGPASDLS
eukprot:3910585-Amphidinium_carterae.1